jgi:hypothetical protein
LGCYIPRGTAFIHDYDPDVYIPSKDSVIVGTGVTIGADVKASGELYNVDLNGGEWKLAISNLPGINFILEG